MISNSTIKYIRSLHQKKNIDQSNVFLLEGEKNIEEVLNSNLVIREIFGTKNWFNKLKFSLSNEIKTSVVTKKELLKISGLKTPNKVIGIVEKVSNSLDYNVLKNGIFLVLDSINNPGNLGTIIRIADWFGITTIICSNNSVKYHNSKVLQSSMGSFTRVNVYNVDLKDFVGVCKKKSIPLFGTFLEGNSIYKVSFPNNFGLVIFSFRNKTPNNIAKIIEVSLNAITTAIGAFENAYIIKE